MPAAPMTPRAKAQTARPANLSTARPQTQEMVGRMEELRVSANLMTLDSGLFCLFQQPGQRAAPQDGSGLPGVRITRPPGTAGHQVVIRGLHDDGWLGPQDGAALVQVTAGPAQILVTVYQSPAHPVETAPRLKVVRLEPEPGTAAAPVVPAASPTRATAPGTPPADTDIVAHVHRTGDVGVAFGDWIGSKGSKLWIEGFGLAAHPDIAPEELEYQAVLGRGWLSPWIAGGKFCGSRGMALPLLGFNLRLTGKAAERFECVYSGTFTDGTEVGPVPAGRTCEAPSLAPLESFRIDLRPRVSPAVVKTPRGAKTDPVKKPPVRQR